ncbi:MAG: SOS response-associated peptidase [Chlorobi bacterium]|nr:SOS response-associated peptidase [Chlorobiota bacterium]
MCFYYQIAKTNAKSLIKNKIIDAEQLEVFDDKLIVSGFNHPAMPVISSDKPEKIQHFYWGLVPKHIKSKKQADEFIKKYNTLNAKAETIFESRIYSGPILTKRCLVLCSGFFEWRHRKIKGDKTEKYPFYITLKNNEMFVFGGIWESFVDYSTGEVYQTYSIITTKANKLLSVIHNLKKRMPLIIPPKDAMNWLQPSLTKEDIKFFLKPFDTTQMKARPIAKINPSLLKTYTTKDFMAYYYYPELSGLLTSGNFEKGGDLMA